MSYGNYNNYNNGYGYRRYRSYSRYGNYGNRQYNRGGSGRRRSMCKTQQSKKDPSHTLVTGWKVGKAGFRSFVVGAARNQRNFLRKDGSKSPWRNAWMIVTNKTANTKSTFPCFIHESSYKVICKQAGLILNPQTGFISYIPRKR